MCSKEVGYRKELNMLSFESDNGYKKICIWKDELPFNCVQQNNMRLLVNAGMANWHIGTICIEARLGVRHISNYAMICMKYTDNQKDNVDILVNYGRNDTFFQSQVLPYNKNVCTGLDKEFADAIYEYFEEYSQNQLPKGTVEILGGGFDEVGSSNFSFKKVMQLLLYVFQHIDNMSCDVLKNELLNLI